MAISVPLDPVRAQQPAAPVQPDAVDEGIFQPSTARSQLTLTENQSRILQLPNRIAQVDGFDPAILSVTAFPNIANQVRIVALAPGPTTIVLVDEHNRRYTIEVYVTGDVRQLEAIIRKSFPDATVQAVKVQQAVLLTGWVSQQDQLTPIIEVAEQYFPKVLNYIKIGGVQQVMLRVKIMEVQRARIRRMGFNFLHLDEHGYVQSTPGLLAPLNIKQDPLSIPFGGPPSATLDPSAFQNATVHFGITASQFIFQGFLEALKEERLLKILAEPNLVTVNGRQANFLNGGEFPIPVPQSLGTVTIQWREFGVKLQFVPYVLGGGRLRLDVEPEVSDTDPTTGVTLNGTTVNGLTTRKVQTQVEMNFGQTLIIAGLINNRTRSNAQKVPFFGELPWIGTAFRRMKEEDAETELLVMVTPELVAPLDAEQVPQQYPGSTTTTPIDRELFFHGMIEVPNYCPPEGGYGTVPPDSLTPIPVIEEQIPATEPAPQGTATRPYDDVPPPPPNENSQMTRNRGSNASPRTGSITQRYQSDRWGKRPGPVRTNSRADASGQADPFRVSTGIQQAGYTVPETTPRANPAVSRPGLIGPSP